MAVLRCELSLCKWGSMAGMNNTRTKINAEFGRLLSGAINSIAVYEGKTAPIVEDELGQQIGLTVASVERYKSGRVPPEPRTVEIFAEAGVQRGYLGRRWLAKFLHTAGYPSPDQLLNKLCPLSTAEQKPERVLHNLPAPSYARFVMREQPYAEVVEALQQRSAVVVIASLGGMGKTCLARELAARCLEQDAAVPHFDAAVWVSDAERPGYTTLTAVLDEIAHTLGYDGITGYGQDEKRREVEQLLRQRRILLIVDNFETITDMELLRWLLKLPEPSKALITTREYRREYRHGTWPVELRGMTGAESGAFITQRMQILHMDKLASDLSQFDPLIEVTGGNPKAIEMALGCLKYERRPLQDVVDDLYQARGELFEDLFHRSWALLDEAARRVLLSMTLFTASVDPEALSYTADVRGLTFVRALERLTDLAFVDAQQPDFTHPARYTLHALVRAFAHNELTKEKDFEEGARSRWLNWYLALVAQVGYCRNDLSRLEQLDPERNMIHEVAGWAQRHQRHQETLAFANGCAFYCYVRGLMNKAPDINLLGAEAAQALQRPLDELQWLSHHVRRLARAGNLDAAGQYLSRLTSLAAGQTLPREVAETYHHSLASYYLALGQVNEAEREWRALLAGEVTGSSTWLVTSKWLALCCRRKGDLAQAGAILQAALGAAGPQANQRAVISLQVESAHVSIALGDAACAQLQLDAARERVMDHHIERHAPDLHMLAGLLLKHRGDLPAARQAFTQAADGFERIGLHLELMEARQELAQL